MKHKILYVTLLFVLCQTAIFAQVTSESRFGGGVLAGFNLSQLDGDSTAGYNKIGINGGIRGIIKLSPRMQVSIDLLYSERGSRSREYTLERVISLSYLEVPLMFHYLDWEVRDKGGEPYYKVGAFAGLTYSRLFNSSLNEVLTNRNYPSVDKFAKTDWAYTLGVDIQFSPHWGLQLKHTQSLNFLYDYESDTKKGTYPFSMKGYFFTVQAMYLF